MLLERFGRAENIVADDGFSIDGRVYLEVEGSNPATMSKSIGLGVIEFTSEIQRLEPDLVLLIGDRYEALSAAIAAAYMNVPVGHIQGGEVSGSIDESARHAITKLAHLHFTATERAAEYVRRMGERPDCVFNVGCPSGDYILSLEPELAIDTFDSVGSGGSVDPRKPFLLVIYHPVTTHLGNEREQAEHLLKALDAMQHPTVWVWPNIDAGADDISKVIRMYREKHQAKWLHLVKNLDPVTYQKALKSTVCAVGNSSSFVRDSTFSGAPVVLIGDRQIGREHGKNLISVPPQVNEITRAIEWQLQHGRYAADTLYGDGNSSQRIVTHLKGFVPYAQKTLQYIYEEELPSLQSQRIV